MNRPTEKRPRRGWVIALGIFAGIAGAIDLFLTAMIPKFHKIFDEMLGGSELPLLTQWIIAYPTPHRIAAMAAFGALIWFFGLSGERANRKMVGLGLCAGFFWAHAIMMVVGLFLPLVRDITVISSPMNP